MANAEDFRRQMTPQPQRRIYQPLTGETRLVYPPMLSVNEALRVVNRKPKPERKA